MIRYVQNKQPNFEQIKNELKISNATNMYTNNGPVKRRLEKHLSEMLLLEDRSVVCTSSGTSALYILISFFELQTNKSLKWATPAFNFPAAVVNKTNIFQILDINLSDYSLSIEKLQGCDGLIIPTLFGTFPDLDKIIDFCKNNNKILILDNASSPLSLYKGKNINTYADACIGSLHHTKYLGFGEGGFAIINKEHYSLLDSLTNFGFLNNRIPQKKATNAKMSDVAAAFILSHVKNYDIKQHLLKQNILKNEIDQIDGVNIFNYSEGVVYGNLAILFDEPVNHLSFRDINIEANKYYKPLLDLPNSLWLYERIINLPLHSELSNFELEAILKKIEFETKRV